MSRLPIRWRLTLAFALSLMVVLAAVGVFLHTKLSTDVDITLERDLRSRADQLEAHLRQASTSGLSPGHTEDLEPEEQDTLLAHSFHADPARMIHRFPRYGELYEARQAHRTDANARRTLTRVLAPPTTAPSE